MRKPDPSAEIDKLWHLATAPFRKLPDFVIAGAPKCATSSLYDAIAAHPGVRRGVRKEPTNFIHYPGSSLRSRMHQPFARPGILSGEGSVEYFSHPDAPASVASVIPRAKLLFVFREPVARAWSDYRMFVRSGHEKEAFEPRVRRAMKWLADPDADSLCDAAATRAFNPLRYVLCGLYGRLLQRWLSHFPREQVKVVFSSELVRQPQEELAGVFEFLGLPSFEDAKLPHERSAGTSEGPPAGVAEELAAFFAEDKRRLETLIERPVPW